MRMRKEQEKTYVLDKGSELKALEKMVCDSFNKGWKKTELFCTIVYYGLEVVQKKLLYQPKFSPHSAKCNLNDEVILEKLRIW